MSSRRDDTRARILRAAARVLQDGERERFRMEDVAAQAGLSRQAIYLHFKSRAELMVEVARHVDREEGLAEMARSVWQAESAEAALARFVALQAEYNPKIYPFVTWGLRGRHRDAALAAAWRDRMESRRRACRRLVLWLRREGWLAPEWEVDAATDTLWAVTSIQLWEALVVETGWTPEQYVAHLLQVLRIGLLAV